MSKAGMAILFFLCAAAPSAWAQSTICAAPAMPAPLDASKASVAQLTAMLAAAQNFMAASNAYQACLANDVQAQKDQAQRDGKPLDPAIEAAMQAKAAATQKDRDKIGAEIDLAVTAFKRAHACEGKQLAACR
jgi:hypothetical protein